MSIVINYTMDGKVDITLDLTAEQLKRHKCMLSSVATDAQVLKHQAISTHNTDKISTTEE